jgi:hypothetical protein
VEIAGINATSPRSQVISRGSRRGEGGDEWHQLSGTFDLFAQLPPIVLYVPAIPPSLSAFAVSFLFPALGPIIDVPLWIMRSYQVAPSRAARERRVAA